MENQADASLNVAFLAQIGQLRIRTDEAVMYLRSSLDSANLLIRSAALNAVTKFGPDVRMKFAGQLNRIATDDKESADVRSKAASLLNQ
jgi:hypothetical protein